MTTADYVIDAELSVIGAMMLQEKCIPQVLGLLDVEDFRTDRGRAVFATTRDLYNAGQPIDPQIVADKLAFDPDARNYIMSSMYNSATPATLVPNCRIIKDGARTEKLRDVAYEITQYNGGALDMADMAAKLRETLDAFESSAASSVSGSEALVAWARYYDAVSNDPGAAYCRTGYRSLDLALGGGLFNGEVYVVAGRPGMGKTTQGINIAERCAKDGKAVLFVSLEMSSIQIAAKRLANASGISYTSILAGSMRPPEASAVYNTAAQISGRPFYVADAVRTVSDIAREAGALKDLALIVVDYMGLIRTGDKPAPRYEEMTRISADLKALAKRLNKPILALAQLNRENTSRSDKRPALSDLRDSGAIEQDAGGVILLHRESYYSLDEEPPDYEPIELIIAKNRHAAPQTVKMMWHGKSGAITDIARGAGF